MSDRATETPQATLLDLSPAEYHADQITDQPTLSASIAKILLNRSPAHAKAAHPKLNPDWQPRDAAMMEFGTAVHALFLENRVCVETITADDWRTKAAREFRDAIRDTGRVPMLQKDWERIQEVVEAARVQCGSHEAMPALFADGLAEQTIVWEDDGVTCRARLDWLRTDRTAIDDLKSTSRSANPDGWDRQLFAMGYDLQAAFYVRGVESLTGTRPEYRLVVVETESPYAVSVLSLSPAAMELANAKVDRALAIWKRCLESGQWPAYTTRVAYVDAPPWAEAQWLEREAREEIAA